MGIRKKTSGQRTSGKREQTSRYTLLMFLCPDCMFMDSVKKTMGRFTVSYLRKEMTDGLPLYCIEIYDALYRLSADGAKLWISICPHSAVLCATVDTTHRIACTLEQTDT